MTSFAQMATALTAHTAPAWSPEALPTGDMSRTERIRRLLKAAHRPVTAAEIAWDMDEHFPNFGSHLVWLLLKYDMAKGRVILRDGLYSWNHDFDTAEQVAIRQAVKLLRSHGYAVREPR